MVKPAWIVQVLSALPLQVGWEWSTTSRVVVGGGQVCPINWAGDRSPVRFLLYLGWGKEKEMLPLTLSEM